MDTRTYALDVVVAVWATRMVADLVSVSIPYWIHGQPKEGSGVSPGQIGTPRVIPHFSGSAPRLRDGVGAPGVLLVHWVAISQAPRPNLPASPPCAVGAV